MHSNLLIIVLISSVFSSCTGQKNSNNITIVKSEELREWVSFLSSDNMKGRANGSHEMQIAASWIAEKYKEMGVMPIVKDGGYIQNYSYISNNRSINERNVIGMIEGSVTEFKNEYIIISAHFDHIGIQMAIEGDSIYNGADDNAAGTCTLIGIAKTIIASGLKPGRTLIFGAFSGEENGAKGSRYFIANTLLPIEKIYVDLNFEMTGHSEFLGKNRYYMTGCAYSNFDDLIGEYNRHFEWKLIDTIPLANDLFFASDNMTFSRINSQNGHFWGIPSGTFATYALGGHVHQPTDEVRFLDFDNMAELVSYFSNLIIWLSKNKAEIKWTDPKFSR